VRLKDQVVIVTGAGSGFGEGIAHRFADEAAKVVVNDIDGAAGERTLPSSSPRMRRHS